MTNEEAREQLKRLAQSLGTVQPLPHRIVVTGEDAAAIRQLLAENERLRWLSDPDENSMIQELRAKVASVACQGCGHKTIHDKGVAMHWCEECVAEKVAALEAALAAKDAEIARLKKLLDRDHTGLASGINAMRQVFRSYGWIPAGEWGSYEWQERTEKHFREEVGRAFDEAERIGETALRESGVRANAAFYPERDELAAERDAREQAQADAARYRNALYQIGCGKETWTREQMIDVAVEALASNAGQPLLDELARLREFKVAALAWLRRNANAEGKLLNDRYMESAESKAKREHTKAAFIEAHNALRQLAGEQGA